MTLTFNKLLETKEDFIKIPKTSAENVAALVVHAINIYQKDEELFFDIIQELMSDLQPLSNMLKDQIKDRMSQNGKSSYIGLSYFNGANNFNNYEPDKSYTIEITDGPSSYVNEGYATLYLKSGGADSKRPITLRKKKDGNWVLWSDSILGLLSDIRKPENQNPWA